MSSRDKKETISECMVDHTSYTEMLPIYVHLLKGVLSTVIFIVFVIK